MARANFQALGIAVRLHVHIAYAAKLFHLFISGVRTETFAVSMAQVGLNGILSNGNNMSRLGVAGRNMADDRRVLSFDGTLQGQARKSAKAAKQKG